MALRARLSPPPQEPPVVWPWHTAKTGSISAHVLFAGDRRMEAETYLSSGYGIRTAIEDKAQGWRKLSQVAKSWQPGRLKGIQLPRNQGTPFLAATQVFDVRPVPRKWLALEKTSDAAGRWCPAGTMIVTCSGSVGRPALTYDAHEGVLISHDLLRVTPILERDKGWVYAYFLAAQTRAMTTSAHYGHIIKHLEVSHLDNLPVPDIDERIAKAFNQSVDEILRLRNAGYRSTLEAEEYFSKAVGLPNVKDWGEKGFSVRAQDTFFSGRRRFEATIHNPGVNRIRKHLARNGQGFITIKEAGYKVWLPTRFRRVPASEGVVLVDSADLTEVNPDLKKMIADGDFGDAYRGRIEAGWILMARSGQTYGIIGTTILAEENLTDKVISDHIMRIKPNSHAVIRPGYLVAVMSHPLFGRPLVKALAYGSSIPEIDVSDIEAFPVVRLHDADEARISELTTSAAVAAAKADLIERRIAADAERIIAEFMVKA